MGSMAASTPRNSSRPMRKRIPMSCSGRNRGMFALSAVVSTTAVMAMSAAAMHLPATIAIRGAGLTSSDSSDPRSRSPAVESVAIDIPPTKAARMMNIGMKLSTWAARCWAVEISISSSFSGVTPAGLTPREIRPERSDFGAVALHQAPDALEGRACGVARGVGDDPDGCRDATCGISPRNRR